MKFKRTVPFLLPLVLIALWHLAALSASPIVLPGPGLVLDTLIARLVDGYFAPHIITTLTEILAGLAIGGGFGFLIGVLMGEFPELDALLSPYLITSQVIPKLALAPLFILWFGFGITSKIIITALICFFPLLENTADAIRHQQPDRLELFALIGASRIQTVLRLKLPAGVPGILAGLRVTVIQSVVGATVGEFIGANTGLGAVIIAAQGMLDTPLIFASLLLITLIGIALYLIVTLISRLCSRYYPPEKD